MLGVLLMAAHEAKAEPISIYSTGVPKCVEKTKEYATEKNIEKISQILDKELTVFGGRKIIDGGRRLVISDCETFFSVVPVEPVSSDVRSIWVDGFVTIIFGKGEFVAPFSGDYLVVVK